MDRVTEDKLTELHGDLEVGIRRPGSRYTVAQAEP
jgi:hypothetical protein